MRTRNTRNTKQPPRPLRAAKRIAEAIERGALDAHFAEVSARQPELHLRADRKVAYEKVADVMAAAQRASIVKIAFLTQPQP